jgi:hypothetical protein
MTGADSSVPKRLFGISFISAHVLENHDDMVEYWPGKCTVLN